MATSIDGRIVVGGWPSAVAAAVRAEYEELHNTFGAEGWICGRVTMEPFAQRSRSDAEVAEEYDGNASRADFRAEGDFESFAFAIDPRGRLAWESNDVGGDHVVAILSERVSNEYLGFLMKKNVSYLLAGGVEIDLAAALEKVGRVFGVRTLLLEGGGRINGSMLRAGLIDEVSLIVAAVADGELGKASLFDVDAPTTTSSGAYGASELTLRSVERRPNNLVWLRYDVDTASSP
jgi:riboflavin biosynthesis pyrimidine reductase